MIVDLSDAPACLRQMEIEAAETSSVVAAMHPQPRETHVAATMPNVMKPWGTHRATSEKQC